MRLDQRPRTGVLKWSTAKCIADKRHKVKNVEDSVRRYVTAAHGASFIP